MTILITIAKNVKKRRLELKFSQEYLAEQADLHPNFISLIERAKCNLSVVTLYKLSKALKCNIADLIGE